MNVVTINVFVVIQILIQTYENNSNRRLMFINHDKCVFLSILIALTASRRFQIIACFLQIVCARIKFVMKVSIRMRCACFGAGRLINDI